jgi:hypothetical protein
MTDEDYIVTELRDQVRFHPDDELGAGLLVYIEQQQATIDLLRKAMRAGASDMMKARTFEDDDPNDERLRLAAIRLSDAARRPSKATYSHTPALKGNI